MSEELGAEEEVEGEEGSDEDQFEEAANQVDDGAAAQAAQPGSGLALPEWAAELLARLAAGDRLDARDQPTFREFCERAKNNPFGGPGVTREGPELEPALRFYPQETAFKYLEEKGGKDFYSFQAFESAAEAIFDVLEKLKVLAPTVVKGVNPQSAEDEADPAYQAEREICKVFNSLNAVYHNVLNSQLSYLQLEAILASSCCQR